MVNEAKTAFLSLNGLKESLSDRQVSTPTGKDEFRHRGICGSKSLD